MIQEKLAELFIVQCEECEHGYHLADDCPHLDEDICMWQRELAAEAHQKYVDDGYVQLADNQELPEIPSFISCNYNRGVGYKLALKDMLRDNWKKVKV